MRTIEVVIALLAGVALLAAVAERAGLPYAAVLVIGGLLVGLIPGLPVVRLHPQLVLFGFLPPLVYAGAFQAASFDLRSQAGHILTLSTGLVLLTVVVVAGVGRAVVGLGWAPALVLGALAAPTDPVSASSVLRHVGAPERITAILEGESLINDGTGLAAFQVAVAAAAGGISVGSGVLRFVVISVGGCAIGLACGWALVRLRRRLDEPPLEIVLGLLTAFGAYTAASAAGASGVLAAVTAGLYAGARAQDISSAGTRLNMQPFWDALVFVLESVLFLLVGLQLPAIVSGLEHGALGTGIAEGALITAVVLAVRAFWMVALRVLAPLIPRVGDSRQERLAGRELMVLGWSGMRGALSLAGALSIPVIAGRHAFAGRDQIIFLIYVVVVGTLVVPSLSLEPLIRRLGLVGGEEIRHAELAARIRVVEAALDRLEELADDGDVADRTLDRLRATLELRRERLDARRARESQSVSTAARADGGATTDAIVGLRRELIAAERQAVAEMRAQRGFPTQVLARIQRDIDLDEARLHG
jgi:Na+/H+ antiporter